MKQGMGLCGKAKAIPKEGEGFRSFPLMLSEKPELFKPIYQSALPHTQPHGDNLCISAIAKTSPFPVIEETDFTKTACGNKLRPTGGNRRARRRP